MLLVREGQVHDFFPSSFLVSLSRVSIFWPSLWSVPLIVLPIHWVLLLYKIWQGLIILLTFAIGGWLYMSIDVQQGINLAS
jgi:hypothetical protein